MSSVPGWGMAGEGRGGSFQIAFCKKEKLLLGDLKRNGSVVPFSGPIEIWELYYTHSVVNTSSPNPLCFHQEFMYLSRNVLTAFACTVPATLNRYSFELMNEHLDQFKLDIIYHLSESSGTLKVEFIRLPHHPLHCVPHGATYPCKMLLCPLVSFSLFPLVVIYNSHPLPASPTTPKHIGLT